MGYESSTQHTGSTTRPPYAAAHQYTTVTLPHLRPEGGHRAAHGIRVVIAVGEADVHPEGSAARGDGEPEAGGVARAGEDGHGAGEGGEVERGGIVGGGGHDGEF